MFMFILRKKILKRGEKEVREIFKMNITESNWEQNFKIFLHQANMLSQNSSYMFLNDRSFFFHFLETLKMYLFLK